LHVGWLRKKGYRRFDSGRRGYALACRACKHTTTTISKEEIFGFLTTHVPITQIAIFHFLLHHSVDIGLKDSIVQFGAVFFALVNDFHGLLIWVGRRHGHKGVGIEPLNVNILLIIGDRIYGEIGSGERVSLAKLSVEKFEKTGRPLRIAIDVSIWQFQILAGQGKLRHIMIGNDSDYSRWIESGCENFVLSSTPAVITFHPPAVCI
jgi:hypothetical protein